MTTDHDLHFTLWNVGPQQIHGDFHGGQGCITMQGTDFDADLGEESFPAELPGFQVTVCCRTGEDVPDTFLV